MRSTTILTTIAIIILFVFGISLTIFNTNKNHTYIPRVDSNKVINIDNFDTINVKITTYSATKSQCDSDPTRTYSGHSTNTNKKIIGASHDLFIKYINIGDTIEIITSCDELSGYYTVEDLGNSKLRNTVDILLPIDSPLHNKLKGKLIIKR